MLGFAGADIYAFNLAGLAVGDVDILGWDGTDQIVLPVQLQATAFSRIFSRTGSTTSR